MTDQRMARFGVLLVATALLLAVLHSRATPQVNEGTGESIAAPAEAETAPSPDTPDDTDAAQVATPGERATYLIRVALGVASKGHITLEPAPDEVVAAEPVVEAELDEPDTAGVDPAVALMRQFGRGILAARETGRACADHVLARCSVETRPVAPEADEVFRTDAATTEAAELLGLSTSQLEAAESVQALVSELHEERIETQQNLDGSQTISDVRGRRLRRLRRALEPELVAGWEARFALAPLLDLNTQLYAQANADVAALGRRLAFLDAAIPYLERRLTAIATLARTTQSELNLQEIQAEINAAQHQLDRESEITERVAAEALAAERRAEEARLAAEEARDVHLAEIAEEWGTIAPLLTQIRDQRRVEEARLTDIASRKSAFLREQATIGDRIDRILTSPESDPTRTTRADRLHIELYELRRDTREAVALVRQEIQRRQARIAQLEQQLARRRGDLELVVSNRSLERDERLYRSLVGLREAQLDLAQKRLELESLRLELQESSWGLTRRQVYFYAQSTDALVDYISSERRDVIFEINGANLLEARENARDRWIGLSLLLSDRGERFDELTTWLSSFDGVRWIGELALLLVLMVIGFRLLRKYRDRILVRVVDGLDRFSFVQQRIRFALELAEVVREALAPAAAYVVVQLVFNRIDLDLAELHLIRSALEKLLVLWLLIRVTRCVIVPQEVRRQAGQDVAPYAVDVLAVEPRRAKLLLMTVRVWLLYAVFGSIALDLVEFLLGRGFAPHLIEVILDWGQVVLVYVLLWFWRDEIVERFLSSTGLAERRTGRLLHRHKNRIYSVLFLAVLALYNFCRWAYRFIRGRVMTHPWMRRLQSFLFRRRIELAGATAEHETLTESGHHIVPPIYLRYLTPDCETNGLTVEREVEVEAVLAAYRAWCEDTESGGGVAVTGERGVGKSVFLDQIARALPEDQTIVRHRIESRVTLPIAALGLVAKLFRTKPGADEDALVDLANEGDMQVILVDDCHLMFLRSIHGFEAFDTFLRVVSLTASRVFWVLTFDRYAWEYLNRVHDRRHHFRRIVDLHGLSEETLRDVIEKRNAAGNLKPDFSRLLVAGRSGLADYEVVKTAEGYYRLLTDYSQGNPTVALHFWRESLRARQGGGVEVALFKKPVEDVLKSLSDRQLFALTAIAQHEELSAEEMSEVVEVEPGLCELDMTFLAQSDLVDIDKRGRASLSTVYLRPVLARLRAANLLYFKNL